MKELQRKPNTYNLLIRIQKVLQRFWPQEIFIQRLLISLLLYSILVFLVAIVFGYHKTPDGAVGEYKNYFQKASWNLYPIFFFIIGVIVRYTWNPFQEAWLRTSKQTPSIVFKENIGEISANDAKKITGYLNKFRIYALSVAVMAGIVWGYYDGSQTRSAYFADTFEQQRRVAKDDPDFTVKWIFEVSNTSRSEPAPAPIHQSIFYAMLEIEQVFLIGLGFLVLFQALIQCSAFMLLDQINIDGFRYKIRLNPKSSSRDFGLSDWNHAIDLYYWFLSAGLLIAIVSMLSQPQGEKDIGMIMAIWGLGALIVAPFLTTILGRIRYIRETEKLLLIHSQDEDAWNDYQKQNGWPMDPKRMQKAGFAICMTLYSCFAGVEIAKFLNFK